MDLFTYLMARDSHNSSVHGDLVSYLMGKGRSQVNAESGTTISINSKKGKFMELTLDKESTQETTTGKNLLSGIELGQISSSTGQNTAYSSYVRSINYIEYNTTDTYYPSVDGTVPTNNFNGRFYNQNKEYIGYADVSKNGMHAVTITKVTSVEDDIPKYFRFHTSLTNVGESVDAKVMISTSSDLSYEPYTGGIPSPNPDYPQEVKTVKGYRNLFDKNNLVVVENKVYNNSGELVNFLDNGVTQMYIPVKPNTTYTISGILNTSSNQRIISFDNTKNFLDRNIIFSNVDYYTFTTGNQTYFIDVQYIMDGTNFNTYQIVEGDQELPYVPYGNNYVNVAVSDGTNTNKYPIPLMGNEIVGIGDYKDELKVDKSGHVFINKKTGKVVLDGNEGWSEASTTGNVYRTDIISNYLKRPILMMISNYFQGVQNDTARENYCCNATTSSSTNYFYFRYDSITSTNDFINWLSTHNTEVYYALETPELIDLNTKVDIKLFKGSNTITNSEDAYMTLKYF